MAARKKRQTSDENQIVLVESAVIVGGDSKIGAVLAAELESGGVEIFSTTRRTTTTSERRLFFDLTEPEVRWPQLPKADVYFLCASVTSMAHCEKDPVRTARVNVQASVALAAHVVKRDNW